MTRGRGRPKKLMNVGTLNANVNPDSPKLKINVPYEIEKGIKIPERESRASLFPFEDMEVGDSFKMLLILNENPAKKTSVLHTAIGRFRRRHPEKKFIIRTQRKLECIRCWRIE